MRILITGVPATGKTTLAKAIAKSLNYKYINEKDLLKKNMYKDVVVFGCPVKDVDLELFDKEALKIKNNVVLDGLMFPETSLKYDFAFVLVLDEKKLRKRMKERKYTDLKIEENVFAQKTGNILDALGSKSDKTYVIERKNILEDLNIIKRLIL